MTDGNLTVMDTCKQLAEAKDKASLNNAEIYFSAFTVYEEQLLFGPSSMVAEVGGILGLFLGISFMTLWNGLAWVVDNSRAVKAWSTGGHLED